MGPSLEVEFGGNTKRGGKVLSWLGLERRLSELP